MGPPARPGRSSKFAYNSSFGPCGCADPYTQKHVMLITKPLDVHGGIRPDTKSCRCVLVPTMGVLAARKISLYAGSGSVLAIVGKRATPCRSTTYDRTKPDL